MGSYFLKNAISIGSWPTNRVSSEMEAKFGLPVSNYLWGAIFEKTPLQIDSAHFLAYGIRHSVRCFIIMGSGGIAHISVLIAVPRPILIPILRIPTNTNTVLVLFHPYRSSKTTPAPWGLHECKMYSGTASPSLLPQNIRLYQIASHRPTAKITHRL